MDAEGGVNQSISGTEQAGGCKQERCSDVKGQAMALGRNSFRSSRTPSSSSSLVPQERVAPGSPESIEGLVSANGALIGIKRSRDQMEKVMKRSVRPDSSQSY